MPFLFVSATSFQSMYYGATAKKIRAYFKALRKAARTEGGAIGFIEEIDAIAMPARRHGVRDGRRSPFDGSGVPRRVTNAVVSEGTGGVVNELLVQMQSFDEPTPAATSSSTGSSRASTCCCPAHRQLQQRKPVKAPILLIAATNRADSLDPALLRPGPVRPPPDVRDARRGAAGARSSTTSWPGARTDAELDDPALRDRLAAATNGWTPVMIEHLLDEALVNALRRGSLAMTFADVEHARITEMVGIGQPVRYTEARAAAHRDARGRPRGHRLARGAEPHARGADDHPPRRRARACSRTATARRSGRTRTTTCARSCRSRWAAGWPRSCSSGRPAPAPPGTSPPATRTAAQMVGAAGMTGLAHLVRRHAARPGLRGAQRRAGPRAARGRARRRPQHRAPAAVPAPPPGRGAARRAARAARADRRRDHRRARGRDPGPGAAARARGERQDARRSAAGAAAAAVAAAERLRRWPSLRGVPEGHTVHRIARQLDLDLVGRPARRQLAAGPVRGRARRGSTGRSSWRADAVGKQLFCTFESGDVLRVHLGPVRRVGLLRVAHAAGARRVRARAAWVRRGCAGRCGWARTSARAADEAAVAVPARARRPGAGAARVGRDGRRPARAVGVRGARPGGRRRGGRAARAGPGVDRRPGAPPAT